MATHSSIIVRKSHGQRNLVGNSPGGGKESDMTEQLTHTEFQMLCAAWMGWGSGGEWIHVYVWLSPFAVHLKLSQHCLLISYTSIQNKKFIFIPTTVLALPKSHQ